MSCAAHQTVTPVFQMAISRQLFCSDRVGAPEATERTCLRSSSARASGDAESERRRPASKSIQRGFREARSELVEILIVGAGKPMGVPRPVVKRMRFAPAMVRAVLETPSLPGALMRVTPAVRGEAGAP